MKALVIGATGLVGSEVIHLLIQDSECDSIHTVSRKNVMQNQKVAEHIAKSLIQHLKNSNEKIQFLEGEALTSLRSL